MSTTWVLIFGLMLLLAVPSARAGHKENIKPEVIHVAKRGGMDPVAIVIIVFLLALVLLQPAG